VKVTYLQREPFPIASFALGGDCIYVGWAMEQTNSNDLSLLRYPKGICIFKSWCRTTRDRRCEGCSEAVR
jgi:hypothetical protein